MPVDTEFCFEGMKCPSYTNRQLRLPRQILNEFLWNVSQDNKLKACQTSKQAIIYILKLNQYVIKSKEHLTELFLFHFFKIEGFVFSFWKTRRKQCYFDLADLPHLVGTNISKRVVRVTE